METYIQRSGIENYGRNLLREERGYWRFLWLAGVPSSEQRVVFRLGGSSFGIRPCSDYR